LTTDRFRSDRKTFIAAGLGGLAWAVIPAALRPGAAEGGVSTETGPGEGIRAVIRKATLFAGIRQPLASRDELAPRISALKQACGDRIAGPLTHIIRFDTPVQGLDSEVGFPVSSPVEAPSVSTHTLREMHFFARVHTGPLQELRTTYRAVYGYMKTRGLSPELELVEVYPEPEAGRPLGGPVEVMASFLAWPEVYRAQLVRVLGAAAAAEIWRGGETVTPHTAVDPRCAWVERSIARLKRRTDAAQQFDILSRVALVHPPENVARYATIYDQSKDVTAVFRAQDEALAKTPTGGFVDPPRFDGKTLHVSKVPYDHEAYRAARTHAEKRKAYCFCTLIREATDPRVDPIFCYRAAGWARQFWEPILGVAFKRCTITHSILKGDDFCAWDYHLDTPLPLPSRDGEAMSR
jgi:effector-binding domain-containing protein